MASGFTTLTNEHLLRTNVWSRTLKELLLDDLNAMKFVRTITDFPDGVTFNIPSLGEAETTDFQEGQAIKYNKMDTGNFTFTFDQYKVSANSISTKFMRDSFYADTVLSAFVPRQHRSLMEVYETRVFNRGNAGQQGGNLNTINGANHRFVGSGAGNSISLQDFAKAQYALTKANVPLVNLCAVVDPSVAYTLMTQTNLVNLITPNRRWENITMDGAVTGFKFMFNVYGWDIYLSNYLPRGLSETINSVSVTNGVCNQFFSAGGGDILPYVGAFRQMPTVFSEFNKDLQQWEYATFMEFGVKLWRPENLVCILTDTTIVT